MEWREDAVTGDYLGGWTAVERACESVFFTPDSASVVIVIEYIPALCMQYTYLFFST